jgi:tetratricopeptide (TPR) repeat protein
LQATAPTETENRAWILARMAHMRLVSGNPEVAESLLKQSLAAFPNDREALEGLAEVRLAQKRYEEATTLLKQAEPTPVRAVNLYKMAQALELAGRTSEAERTYEAFEAKAEADSAGEDNANRDLILYDADRAHQPAKALQLAKREIAWRHDVYTRDAYAWALHVNGRSTEAREQIEIALAVGIRDATIFWHAGEIALKLEDRTAAERYFKQSVELSGLDSNKARLTLASLEGGG